jgi:hypothetical protein
MKYLFLISILLLFSCSPKTFNLKGENLTKRQFDRKLKKYTDQFIKENPEFIELWKDVQVIYDTTKNQ